MHAIRSGLHLAAPLLATLPVLALTAGCAPAPPKAGAFQMPPTPVEVVQATSSGVTERFTALGTVAPADGVDVVSEIDGRVTSLPYDEGQAVAKGAVLVKLDDTQLVAELARAEAVRDHDKTNVARLSALVEQRISAPQALDDATADLAVAEADVAVARARLAKTVVRAPFPGLAGTRRVSVGAWLHAGDVVTSVSRVDEIKVSFPVPERMLGELHDGAAVRISSPAFADAQLDGKVTVIDPVVDAATRTAHVTARAANTAGRFRPGMSVDVSLALAERPQAITIPAEAVFFQGGQAMAYAVQADGTVAPRPLNLGAREADSVEVVSGLAAGDTVVRAGQQKLGPGSHVKPVDEPKATSEPAPAR